MGFTPLWLFPAVKDNDCANAAKFRSLDALAHRPHQALVD
jgi:hypothetical protein